MEIISVNEKNLVQYPPLCFINPKNEGSIKKIEWVREQLPLGLKIKLLYLENTKKCNGYIEYIRGENAWRAVNASGYTFIHCIWISPNKYKEQGYATRLLETCLKDARENNQYGVAVVTSEGSFMTGEALFSKNGFKTIARAEPSYQLMVKTFREGSLPYFKDWQKRLAGYQGWHLVYSRQCPWVARSISELMDVAQKHAINLNVTELKTPQEAQNAPSVYAVFNLIYNGQILADHYISTRRFENLIKKVLQ